MRCGSSRKILEAGEKRYGMSRAEIRASVMMVEIIILLFKVTVAGLAVLNHGMVMQMRW